MNNKRGTTLIECLLVLMLIGMFATLLVPSVNQIKKAQFETTVKTVYQMLQTAQQMAHFRNERYSISSKDQYVYMKRGTLIEESYRVPDHIEVHVGSREPNRTTYPITFTNDMSPDKAGTVTIKDRRSDERVEITVSVATGKLTIYRK